MAKKKSGHTYEVTLSQLLVSLLVAAAFFVSVFEVGVLIGKRRAVSSQMALFNNPNSRYPLAFASAETGAPSHVPANPQPPTKPAKPPVEKSQQTAPAKPVDVTTSTAGPIFGSTENEKIPEQQAVPAFSVKVGTFRSSRNARQLIDLLKSYEYEPFLRPEDHNGETLYAVMLGQFDTAEEADEFGRLLQKRLSYINGYLVKEVPRLK